MSLPTFFADTPQPSWARALAASLPASIRLIDTPGDIILIDGSANWPERLRGWIERGHDRILLVDPQVHPIDRVAALVDLARRHNCLVLPSETHADNPAVPDFRQGLSDDVSIVTITGHGTQPVSQLALEQLRLARACGFKLPILQHAIAADDGLLATLLVDHNGVPVTLRLTVARCDASWAHHVLTTHATTASDIISVYGEATARPAEASHVRSDSLRTHPAIYEDAHRARLRLLLESPSTAHADLATWIEDARLSIAMSGSRQYA